MTWHNRRCAQCNSLIAADSPDICDSCTNPPPKPPPQPKPKVATKAKPEPEPKRSNSAAGPAIRQNGCCRICGVYILPKRRQLHEAGMDIKGLECGKQDLASIIETVRAQKEDWRHIQW